MQVLCNYKEKTKYIRTKLEPFNKRENFDQDNNDNNEKRRRCYANLNSRRVFYTKGIYLVL